MEEYIRNMLHNAAEGRHGDTLRLLDNISNDLCRVLDLTECIRQVRPTLIKHGKEREERPQ